MENSNQLPKRKRFQLYVSALAALSILLVFQNCSDVSFSSPDGVGKLDCEFPPCVVAPGEPFSIRMIVNAPSREADILFLVDTSGSMSEEMSKIRARFANLVESLPGIEWRIGITNMTPKKDVYLPYPNYTGTPGALLGQDIVGSGGRLVPMGGPDGPLYITPSTVNASGLFESTIELPIACSKPYGNSCNDVERGIYQANNFLDISNPHSQMFFRKTAHTNLIMVSDENERSSGNNLEPLDLPETLIMSFNTAQLGTSLSVHSLIAEKDVCAPGEKDHYGTYYRKLSDMTGGIVGKICAEDYTSQLTDIGIQIGNTTKSVQLPCVASSISNVSLTPSQSGISFSLQGDKLAFSDWLIGGTVVNVSGVCK